MRSYGQHSREITRIILCKDKRHFIFYQFYRRRPIPRVNHIFAGCICAMLIPLISRNLILRIAVCGEVQASGVYELEQDSRVFEAIAKAGGLTENAAAEAVNQARVVVDGEQIYVPSLDEVKGAGVVSEVTERTDDGKININTAEKEELMTLTGVGEAKAQSIIAYREEHGGFQSIEELMQIEGIKEGVFNKIKEDITI